MSAYHPSTNTIELNAVYAALSDGQYSLDSVFFEAMNAYQCRVATEGHKSSDPVQFSETELEEIRSGVEKVRRTDTTDQKRDYADREAMCWEALVYSGERMYDCGWLPR